jgi:hypothetical protein
MLRLFTKLYIIKDHGWEDCKRLSGQFTTVDELKILTPARYNVFSLGMNQQSTLLQPSSGN